ncbi:MAG: calcium-binding protein [Pseudomonadota bacterium]
MATITFGAGISGNVALVINLIDSLTSDASLTGFSPTQITFQDGDRLFVVTGTGFVANLVTQQLTGGVINQISVTNAGTPEVTIGSIGLLAVDLNAALVAEDSGADIAALETLLTGLSYDYNGVAGADVLRATTRSSDGVLLNLRGNDTFDLFGGNDNVFMGDGNDQGFGGSGRDTLGGGNGNDTLTGQSGNDSLSGGAGNDALNGNAGDDHLIGDTGNDRIKGGTGDDSLSGGAGRDILYGEGDGDHFIFGSVVDTGNGATRDQIADFDRTEGDVIDLTGFGLVAFRGSLGFSNAGPSARWVVSGGNNVLLQIDSDGDRDVDGTILILNHTSLLAGDVLI